MLYNYCSLFVVLMAIVLLISMLGVIILTSGLDQPSIREGFFQDMEFLNKSLNITV